MLASSIDLRHKSASLPEPDDDEVEEAFYDDASNISDILQGVQSAHSGDRLPPAQHMQPMSPFKSLDAADIDISQLISLRHEHQTKQASSGIRKRDDRSAELGEASKELTERQRLLKAFSEIIREQGDKGVGSGKERTERWRNNGVPGNEQVPRASGNSANAAEVARTAGQKACSFFVSAVTGLNNRV